MGWARWAEQYGLSMVGWTIWVGQVGLINVKGCVHTDVQAQHGDRPEALHSVWR